MTGQQLAAAAESFVGVRFRLHGRDPATGLDCIGLLAASLARLGQRAVLPAGYSLRMRSLPEMDGFVFGSGLVAASAGPQPGDVRLVAVGPGQVHLVITASDLRVVHAHAGLARVIHSAMPANWPTLGHWRLRGEN